MFKKLALLTLLASPLSTHADWSDFTLLGTVNNVVFSYRTYNHPETAKGSNVQFRVMNLNSMRARVLISDIKLECYDGSIESAPVATKRLRGGETHLFDAAENICQERGGFKSLSVSLDARVRR